MSQEEVCSSHRTPRLETGHKLMTALRSLSNSLGYLSCLSFEKGCVRVSFLMESVTTKNFVRALNKVNT